MKRKVLIVDDVADIRLMLRSIIEREGYQIVGEAANGMEAVELYFEHYPDITIMDIDMPYMTGVEAAQQILSHASDARIVFCTGGTRSREVAALGLSPVSVVSKPFLPAQLYRAMNA